MTSDQITASRSNPVAWLVSDPDGKRVAMFYDKQEAEAYVAWRWATSGSTAPATQHGRRRKRGE